MSLQLKMHDPALWMKDPYRISWGIDGKGLRSTARHTLP